MVIKKEETYLSHLIFSKKKKITYIKFLVLLSFASVFIGINYDFFILLFIGFFSFWVGIVLYIRKKNELNSYESGYRGEKIFMEHLKSILSDDYFAYFSFPIKDREDIDCVVVGPSGIYIFEVKHHHGEIRYTKDGWRQLKIGGRGTVYPGGLEDPSQQLKRNLHKLKKILESRGISDFIQGVIVFTNPLANLYIEKDLNPLIVCKLNEVGEIINRPVKKPLPKEKIAKIVTVLDEENKMAERRN